MTLQKIKSKALIKKIRKKVRLLVAISALFHCLSMSQANDSGGTDRMMDNKCNEASAWHIFNLFDKKVPDSTCINAQRMAVIENLDRRYTSNQLEDNRFRQDHGRVNVFREESLEYHGDNVETREIYTRRKDEKPQKDRLPAGYQQLSK